MRIDIAAVKQHASSRHDQLPYRPSVPSNKMEPIKIITNYQERVVPAEQSRQTLKASVQQTGGTLNTANKYGPVFREPAPATEVFTGLLDALQTRFDAGQLNFIGQSKVVRPVRRQEPDSFIDQYFKNKIELVKLEIERNKQT